MKRKIFLVAMCLALCFFVSSCAVKANKGDDVFVVQDVLNTENGSVITFRNSDMVLQTDYRPFLFPGQVVLLKQNGQYMILSENNHFDFIIVLLLIIFAFLAGCLTAGRYVRKCLKDEVFKVPEEWGKTSGCYFG